MALTVKFWNFGKMENSTVQPSTTPLQTYTDILLKDDCSVVNPAIKLNVPMNTTVYNWNYCQIVEFSRYYFIADWIWSEGLWIAELEVDVLASFRDAIGTQSVYVLRSYQDSSLNTLFDGTIPDTTYPCTSAQATYTSTAVDNPFGLSSGTYTEGTYIVGIVNKNAENGSVTYYAFNALGFKQFCTKLYTYSSGWLNIDVTEISEDLQKALINPFQYVVSCFYLPVPVTYFTTNNIGTATYTVYFGWWSITIATACRTIPYNARFSSTHSLTIPRHPQAATRGTYLNLSPYSYYTLRFYPYGTFDIDSEAIAGWTTLDLYNDVDICSGKGILTIAVNGKNNPIRTIEANISVPMPTASIQVDYANLGTKTTALVAGAAAVSHIGSGEGNFFQNMVAKGKEFIANVRARNTSAIGAGFKNAISNIASSVMAGRATVELMGQQGSFSLYELQTLTLSGRFLPMANEDFYHRGRPLCQVKTINTLHGFILCSDADVNVQCTDREKSAIEAYMNGGFYYH